MKLFKIVLVFASLLFAGQALAQDATVNKNGGNFNVALDAADTLSNNSTTLSKTISVNAKGALQLYSIQVTVDSISGTPTQAWVLAGSIDNENWNTISTVNWTGTDGDTTFYYTDISTGVAWPYLRVQGTESGTAKGQLTKLKGRLIDKVR